MTTDVVDLIMNDHREMERMFDLMRTSPDQRAMLLPLVSSMLMAHSRAEEAEVYPAARDEAGQADDVEHSQEEHLEAEQLLAKLQGIDPYAAEFEPALQEFIDAVTHHVEEEESDLLPGMRQGLSDDRRRELGEAFLETRAEHLGTKAGELSRAELDIQAENLGLDGTSSMSKEELQREVEKHAES